jgi:hypothetical protein
LGRVDELADGTGGSVDTVMGAAIGPDRNSRSTSRRIAMYARTVTVALLLCAALALPVAADAGQCGGVVVYFQKGTDSLDIVNIQAVEPTLQFQLFKSDGTLLASASVILTSFIRLRMTATDVYALFKLKTSPGFTSSWVAIGVLSFSAATGPWFSATVTHGDEMRELGCISV